MVGSRNRWTPSPLYALARVRTHPRQRCSSVLTFALGFCILLVQTFAAALCNHCQLVLPGKHKLWEPRQGFRPSAVQTDTLDLRGNAENVTRCLYACSPVSGARNHPRDGVASVACCSPCGSAAGLSVPGQKCSGAFQSLRKRAVFRRAL